MNEPEESPTREMLFKQPADEFWPAAIPGRAHIVHLHSASAEFCNVHCCVVATLEGLLVQDDDEDTVAS